MSHLNKVKIIVDRSPFNTIRPSSPGQKSPAAVCAKFTRSVDKNQGLHRFKGHQHLGSVGSPIIKIWVKSTGSDRSHITNYQAQQTVSSLTLKIDTVYMCVLNNQDICVYLTIRTYVCT